MTQSIIAKFNQLSLLSLKETPMLLRHSKAHIHSQESISYGTGSMYGPFSGLKSTYHRPAATRYCITFFRVISHPFEEIQEDSRYDWRRSQDQKVSGLTASDFLKR